MHMKSILCEIILNRTKVHGEDSTTEHCSAIDLVVNNIARVQKVGYEVLDMFQLDYLVFVWLLSHAR